MRRRSVGGVLSVWPLCCTPCVRLCAGTPCVCCREATSMCGPSPGWWVGVWWWPNVISSYELSSTMPRSSGATGAFIGWVPCQYLSRRSWPTPVRCADGRGEVRMELETHGSEHVRELL